MSVDGYLPLQNIKNIAMCLQIIKIKTNASMHVEQIWETLVISRGWKPDKEGCQASICDFVTLFEFLFTYIKTSLVI